MEIHPPDHAPASWTETAKHLAIITAGVLIALTLEGIVSWVDHRMLVREAVANLTAELRNNKKELDGLFANLQTEEQQLEHADEMAVQLAKGPIAHGTIALDAHGAELKNAAVTTGQITGAFGYMEYEQVRRYADVYDLQAQYMRLQEREGQHFSDVLAFIRPLVTAERPPSADAIERWKSAIDVALAGILARRQLGQQLQRRYDEILAGR
jgi:hypothetical protein